MTSFVHHSARMMRLVSGVFMLCVSPQLLADGYIQQLSVPVSLEYDTNPLMQSGDAKAIWRTLLIPRYSVVRKSDVDQWNADFALRFERSSDQSIVIGREDPSLGLGWRREFEKGQVGVKLGYDEASSRASTLDEIGRVSVGDTTRVTKSIGADGQYALSEKLTLSLNGNYSRATFRGKSVTNPDSNSYAAGVVLSYLYSQYIQPYVQLTANRYVPDDTSAATNLYGVVGGAKWQATDKLNLGAYAGLTQMDSSSEGDWQAGANLAYMLEKDSYTLALTRAISPAGNGGFIQSEQAIASWRRELSDYASAGVDVSLRRNSGTNSGENNRLNVWYGRDLSQDWNLKVSWQHKQSKNSSDRANGNVLGLAITYNFFKQ